MNKINFNEKDGSYNDEKFNSNYIPIKEFREKGYLQELNRKFLHPLGLALEVGSNGEDDIILGIVDVRNDGICFNIKDSSDDRKERFVEKQKFIESELNRMKNIRGYKIEEI